MQIGEALGSPGSSPIHDALVAGEQVLSQNQEVAFMPYVRQVLPLDGFVFWVNARLLAPDALAAVGLTSSDPVTVQGSLHYATAGHQDLDQTMVIRQVDFTVPQKVDAFGTLDSAVMYIGVWETPLGSFKFTFSQRNNFYEASKIWHYVGDAVYPAMDSQIIDDIDALDPDNVVVSNSLPIWLNLNTQNIWMQPFYPTSDYGPLPLYPSFAVPDNLPPPYVAVHIRPGATRALQAFPTLGRRTSSRHQLVVDQVQLVFYGVRNDGVSDFLDYLFQYSVTRGDLGIMNMPVISDEKRTQTELAVLAIKKTVDVEVNYYQSRARDVARKIILSAMMRYRIPPGPPRGALFNRARYNRTHCNESAFHRIKRGRAS